MIIAFTCGSWLPQPPGRWAGLREKVRLFFRKWAATAFREDQALTAAGNDEDFFFVKFALFAILEHFVVLRLVMAWCNGLSMFCTSEVLHPLLFTPPSTTRVTVLLLLRSCDLLCIGTEGGGVYFLDLPSLSLKASQTLPQDQVTQRWDCCELIVKLQEEMRNW